MRKGSATHKRAATIAVYFSGTGLLFCLWSSTERTRIRYPFQKLAVYTLPDKRDHASEKVHGGVLAMVGLGEINGDSTVHNRIGLLYTEDTPNAKDLKRCLQDDSCEAVFKFLVVKSINWSTEELGILTARFTRSSASLLSALSMNSQLVTFPFSDHTIGHGIDHVSVQLRSRNMFTLNRLHMYQVNFPKIFDLISQGHSNTRNLPEEALSNLVLTKCLQGELLDFWPTVNEDLDEARAVAHFDIITGRLFIILRNGLHVLDYT